jgi:uncharacterized protein (DUF58 family)
VATFAGDVQTRIAPASGRAQLQRALAVLDGDPASGASDISSALMRYGAVARGPGLAVVVSDFLTPDRGAPGLEYLLHRGLSPAAVQVLAPEDRAPGFEQAELIDAERPGATGLPADEDTIAGYKERLAEHLDAMQAFCSERGIPLARVGSEDPFDTVIRELERVGLVSSIG